jgi:hypothetical protein
LLIDNVKILKKNIINYSKSSLKMCF